MQVPSQFMAVAALLFVTAACQEGYRVVREDARETGANIRLNNFVRNSVLVTGEREWNVTATEAYIYQTDGKETNIIAYEFEFTQFDEKGKVHSTLTAERGEIDYEEQKMHLSGEVLYKSSEQIIETEKLAYEIETEVVTSDVHVRIREGSSVTNCRKGVVVDRLNERQVCKSPVGLSISTPGTGSEGNDGGGAIDIFQ